VDKPIHWRHKTITSKEKNNICVPGEACDTIDVSGMSLHCSWLQFLVWVLPIFQVKHYRTELFVPSTGERAEYK
jgi:hypothetical protein